METAEINLACPRCGGNLSGLRCEREGVSFETFRGYANFVGRNPQDKTTTEEYAECQGHGGPRVFAQYVRPWLSEEPFGSVLDVGCGVGHGVRKLVEEGHDAYGMDLPNLAPFWESAGNGPERFLLADAEALPFPDERFDAVVSLGVVEHIGTENGHLTLRGDYEEKRRRFASEILRVLKPGGRALVSCPHKRFPLDIQHGPSDPLTPAHPVRKWLWKRAHVTIHKTWGTYYLPTYGEIERWFGRKVRPLPLRGYFGFASFSHPVLRPALKAATFYVENLPALTRKTPLNPYVLAEIRK